MQLSLQFCCDFCQKTAKICTRGPSRELASVFHHTTMARNIKETWKSAEKNTWEVEKEQMLIWKILREQNQTKQ